MMSVWAKRTRCAVLRDSDLIWGVGRSVPPAAARAVTPQRGVLTLRAAALDLS